MAHLGSTLSFGYLVALFSGKKTAKPGITQRRSRAVGSRPKLRQRDEVNLGHTKADFRLTASEIAFVF